MSDPQAKQVVVSILLRRRGDRVDIKLARAEKLGQPPTLEHEASGDLATLEDVFVDNAAPYLKELFAELRRG